jgi:hypothetical protein
MILLGEFTGGAFEASDGKYRLERSGDCVIFNGATPHLSHPFQGARISLVLFLHKATLELPPRDIAFLHGTGFIFVASPNLNALRVSVTYPSRRRKYRMSDVYSFMLVVSPVTSKVSVVPKTRIVLSSTSLRMTT